MCQGQHPPSPPNIHNTPFTHEVERTSVMEGELAMVTASSGVHKHMENDGHKVHALYPTEQCR